MKALVLILTLLIGVSVQAAPYKTNAEFRGMWVITWEIFKKGGRGEGEFYTGEKLQKNILSILDNVKKAGLNAVMWQVRQGGTVYYPSQIEPWGKWVRYASPGFDPLKFTIEEAHKRNIEVHAWFNTFESRDSSAGTPAANHPEWICRDENNEPMPEKFTISPGLKAVRDHVSSVVMEVVNNYNIDGVHMDYIRWSEYPMGEEPNPNRPAKYFYDSEHKAEDGVPWGHDTWKNWRRDSVTTFVRDLNRQIKEHKAHLIFSVAAIGKYNWGGWNGYNIVYQDAAKWLNEGLIDHIMGMNYSWRTSDDMYDGLYGNCPDCWDIYIQEGLAKGGRYTPGIGSLMLRNRNMWDNHFGLVDIIRTIPWNSGVQFFSYGDWLKQDFFEEARTTIFSDL